MNDKKKNITHYSAADIQRYLNGQMSADEMHAIETAALDDPFLADAIEGFQMTIQADENSINAGLGKLNKEFSDRIKQPGKVISMTQSRWWQIAAVAMMLVITGVAFYNNWIKPGEKTSALALHEKRSADSSGSQREDERSTSTTMGSDTLRSQVDKPVPAEISSTKPLASPNSAKSTSEPANQSKEKLSASNKLGKANEESVLHKAETPNEVNQEAYHEASVPNSDIRLKRENAAVTKDSESQYQGNKPGSSRLKKFSGRVVDADNKPLANASLKVLQNRSNVTTDESGRFNFSASDSIVDVQVALVGYEERHFRLYDDSPSNSLVLEPDKQALREVVVTGYGTQKKTSPKASTKTPAPESSWKTNTKATVKVQDAVPLVGWTEYEKYLEKNKRPPLSNPLLKGEVVVSFQITRRGTLSEFKIEKSLSKEHDAEAIRLITEGPEWKLLKDRKSRITVIVNF